jgi:hypothetical protein
VLKWYHSQLKNARRFAHALDSMLIVLFALRASILGCIISQNCFNVYAAIYQCIKYHSAVKNARRFAHASVFRLLVVGNSTKITNVTN